MCDTPIIKWQGGNACSDWSMPVFGSGPQKFEIAEWRKNFEYVWKCVNVNLNQYWWFIYTFKVNSLSVFLRFSVFDFVLLLNFTASHAWKNLAVILPLIEIKLTAPLSWCYFIKQSLNAWCQVFRWPDPNTWELKESKLFALGFARFS